MTHCVTVHLVTLHRNTNKYKYGNIQSLGVLAHNMNKVSKSDLDIDLSLEYPLQVLILVILSCRTLGATAVAGCIVTTVPPPSGDLRQSHTVDVEASVAEVTEQHLVLVLGLVTAHALLTVSALPLVARHKLQR